MSESNKSSIATTLERIEEMLKESDGRFILLTLTEDGKTTGRLNANLSIGELVFLLEEIKLDLLSAVIGRRS